MDGCRVCDNQQDNKLHRAREMMFGLRDEFDYVECGACGCVQIQSLPADLSKYYPGHYWDFQRSHMPVPLANGPRRYWRRRVARYWLHQGRDPVGRLLALNRQRPQHMNWFRRAGINDLSTAILDVGCGLGQILLALQREGFDNLTGLDPYIDNDISYAGRVRVFKRSLYDHDGQYDFIMLHHSYEHMEEPRRVMQRLRELCKPGGCVLIRIPLADSYAFENYGVDWVQFDAPRHLYLHTRKSIELLAEQAGFHIGQIVYDSDATQFVGSEQYRRDITLYDEQSYEVNPENSIFTTEQIASFRAKANALNRSGRGDQACFYLYKDASS